jgi:hypothetical protein
LESVSVATTSLLIRNLIAQVEGRSSDLETNTIGANLSPDGIYSWQQDRLSQICQQQLPQTESLEVQTTSIGSAQPGGIKPLPVINCHGPRSEFGQNSP